MFIEAVIFDCDGTLVDSELVGNRALVEYASEFGLVMSLKEAVEEFAGRKMADTLRIIETRIGQPLPAGFLPEARRRMAAAFELELKTIDGVPELLAALDIPCCVASNGPSDKMRISLGVTGLLPRFEGRIYSAYDCNSWKPDPGLLLYAAREMGVSPGRCALVEDSRHGIEAGLAAGMTVFAFSPRPGDNSLAIPGVRLFHHMNQLLPLLEDCIRQ